MTFHAGRDSTASESGELSMWLPPAIWRQVAEHLSVPDLIKAAATHRLFQEALGKRVRAAINRCLNAAEACWGAAVLAMVRTMSSLVLFGLHPLRLHVIGGREAAMAVTREPGGQLRVASLDRGLAATDVGCAILRAARDELASRMIANIIFYGVRIDICGRGAGASPEDCIVTAYAKEGEVQQALGVLLAVMHVGRQVVIRGEGASLSKRVPPPWWLEDGRLILRVTVPREDTREHVDARGQLHEGIALQIWQRALQTDGAADALCVAVAMEMRCNIAVTVAGDTHGGLFRMWPTTLL